MLTKVLVRKNSYYDSVTLMALSGRLSGLAGVSAAVVAMGTDMNKELLQNVGLMTAEAESAGPADLVIAVGAGAEAALDAALAEAEASLRAKGGAAVAKPGAPAPRTIRAAVRAAGGAGPNLALISVPGPYAAREAREALEQGLHVMVYSDNVSLADEVRLKQIAHERGLLMMGPDCGTAILDGVGLGFANAVRRGPVGIVAASGTGAQELSCQVDALGSGVSQVIGTGGRDLSEAVGGIMMLDGMALLSADPETRVIVLISKQPAPAVAERVMAAARACAKPVIPCFLGRRDALSMDETAVRAVSLADRLPPASSPPASSLAPIVPGPGRKYVRGLFSGGTLGQQALGILARHLGPVACGDETGPGHRVLDLGDDRFTRGRPHPMIDMTLRQLRIRREADDPETAVILLDVVLGHGAHRDPAGALAESIRYAVSQGVVVVASVTGTEADPQRRSVQVETLQAAGALVARTARTAAQLVARGLVGRGEQP